MRPDHIRAGLPGIFVILTGEQNLQNGAIWFDIKEAVHKHISGADDNDPVSLLIKQSQIGAILFDAVDIGDQRIVPLPVIRVSIRPHNSQRIEIVFLLSSYCFETFR